MSTARQRRLDPTVKLCHNVRSWICCAISRKYSYRKWELKLGYTIEELKEHLQSQFWDGMSFDNYGEWHIDHIVPQVAFSFTSPDDPAFRDCWGLHNLRPMWSEHNGSKGSLMPDPKATQLKLAFNG
jgi:hypothetical protein